MQLPAERGHERPAIDLRSAMGASQHRVASGGVEGEGPDESGGRPLLRFRSNVAERAAAGGARAGKITGLPAGVGAEMAFAPSNRAPLAA